MPGVIPKSMRAIVYRGPDRLELETVPVPRIGPDEILVRVEACGVCPTDVKKIHYGTAPPPRIFGHETAGVAVKIGARVRGIAEGDRVALHHHVPCLACHACRRRAFAQCAVYKKTGITAGFEPAGGGYAEYVRVMNFVLPGVVKIPRRNSFLEGAMLEPVNTVLKAIEKLRLLPGDQAAAAGQGPIGLIFTRLLCLRGIRVLATDLFERRLAWAASLGAEKTWRADDPRLAERIGRWTEGRGLDAAILATPSNEAARAMSDCLRGGGQLLFFANTKRGDLAQVDLSAICVDEKDYVGSYSSDFTLQKRCAQLVFGRRLDVRPLITHCFPLSQTAEAVALAARPAPDSLKIAVVHSAIELDNARSLRLTLPERMAEHE